jgi:glycerol-3-phosphate dehydrogenase
VCAGGKWTTYRLMAEDAMNAVCATGRVGACRPCMTQDLRLLGAAGYHPALFTEVAQNYVVPHRPGAIDTHVAQHLAGVPPPPPKKKEKENFIAMTIVILDSSEIHITKTSRWPCIACRTGQ